MGGTPMERSQHSSVVSIYIGIVALSLVVIVNPVVLGSLVSPRKILKIYALLFDLLVLGIAALAFLHIRTKIAGFFRAAVLGLVALPLLMVCTELALGYVRVVHLGNWRGSVTENLRQPDLELGWSLIPNVEARGVSPGNFEVVYRIDAQGRKAVPQAAATLPTLHFFGDSFTFGNGVTNDDTHLNLLAAAYGDRINVLNYGVSGYGLEQMFIRFRNNSGSVRPGDIVLFTPMSYDLLRSIEFGDVVCSQIFEAKPGTWRFPVHQDGIWDFVDPHAECSWHKALLIANRNLLPVGHLYRRLLINALFDGIVRNADAIFAQAEALARERGADFFLVFFLHPDECAKGAHNVDIDRLKTPFVSLLRYCPEDPAEIARLRFATDGHWSAYGHSWAADALDDILRNVLGVIP